MQWKFQSTWKSTDFTTQPSITDFLASSDYLYVSDVVVGGLDKYFTLSAGYIQLWDSGVKQGEWVSMVGDVIVSSYASAPASPLDGLMYINTGDNKLYIYYGGEWQALHTLSLVTSAPVYIETGVPQGLLLGITYQT